MQQFALEMLKKVLDFFLRILFLSGFLLKVVDFLYL